MWDAARCWFTTTAAQATRRAGAFGAALLLFGAAGQPAASQTLAATDLADVQRIEGYLNQLKTLESRFIQTNPDGSVDRGTLYLQRPDRLRLAYDRAPYRIVAKGGWLIYADDILQQATYLRVNETPAAFLLRDDLDLMGGDIALADFARADGVLRVVLVQRNNPGAGSVTLDFTDGPLELARWQVLDARGDLTETVLVEPAANLPVPQRVFEFDDRSYETVN